MTCGKCGAEVAPGARFCVACGGSLGAPPQVGNRIVATRPGKVHRFCLALLMIWTAFPLGLAVATSAGVGNPEAHPGAVLGWMAGIGILLAVWAVGAVVLAVLAIAVKPSPSVAWPRFTKWVSGILTALAFLWPIYTSQEISNRKGLAEPTPQAPEGSSATSAASSWQVQISTSPMDGSRTVALELESDSEFQSSFGQHRATLVLRCQEKKTEAYVLTGTPASVESAEDTHTVRLRFDQLQPVTEHWSESTDSKGLFAPNGRQLIARLVKADVLTFEFTPFDANPAIASFNLKGLAEHVGDLAKACSLAHLKTELKEQH